MISEIRFSAHPEDVKKYTTQELRDRYLIPEVMKAGQVTAVYSMHDSMLTMGAVPTKEALELPVLEDLTKANYFLERREMGVINVGGTGSVVVEGEVFTLHHKDCLYIGKGIQKVHFQSDDENQPAEFYINSCPAHHAYPVKKATMKEANEVKLGSREHANERTIYQYIHESGIQSCQLVMGFTLLAAGSVWNTFPPHTHYRRMEVYFYFDLAEDQIVMHFMGDPRESRHIAMKNKQAVISPEWSIHAGAGTSNYAFVWSMAGENKAFTDMDGESLINIL